MGAMPQRKLAAILAADVAGYSRHIAADEAGTLARLRLLRNDILTPAVAGHGGEIVKSMGDGWLIEFASVAEAVRCAIDIQTQAVEPKGLRLRVGVHAGDVVHEDEDIYGDGVNIAARLQQVCPPGGILISDFARQSIDAELGGAFTELGAKSLKNIPSALIVHGWRGGQPGAETQRVWSDADHLIVALARTGDREAFGELVRRRQSWIRNFMRRAVAGRSGDTALADDLAQQVFLQAWQHIGQLKQPERFDGWLRKMAVNIWLAHLRRNDALRDAADIETTTQTAEPPASAVAIDLDRALAALPAAMRLAVVLAYHEGMTHEEIAEATGQPLGTVKSNIRRGGERLRATLSDYQTEANDA